MVADWSLLNQVRDRGRAALDEWRNQATTGGSAAQRGLASRSQVLNAYGGGPTPAPMTTGSRYQEAMAALDAASRWRAGPTLGTGYGQTVSKKGEPGKYAGFPNASDLWNAVSGRAEFLRDAATQDIAGRQAQTTSDLDTLEQNYQEALDAALKAFGGEHAAAYPEHVTPITPTQRGGTVHSTATLSTGQTIPVTYQAAQEPAHPMQSFTSRQGSLHQPLSQTEIGQAQETAGAHSKYLEGLNQWLGTQADPLTQQLGAYEQAQNVPLSEYAAQAGQEYGIDPNLVRGRFGDQANVSDYATQRNLGAWQDFGMPYSEVVTAQNQALGNTQDAQKAYLDQQEAQLADAVTATAGYDARQLSTAANLSIPQLYDVVNSPDFQQADADVASAIQAGDANLFDQALRNIGTASPEAFQVLLQKYSQYAGGFDFFNPQGP